MRRAGTFLVILMSLGCGEKTAPHPGEAKAVEVPAAQVSQAPKEEPYQDAEKGPVKVVGVMVSVKGASWTKLEDRIPTVTVFVGLKMPADSTPTILQGWAYDKELVSKLTGLSIQEVSGPAPLPVNFAATTDTSEKLRGVMRSVQDDTPGSADTEVATREIRTVPGRSYGWVLTFERPGPNAKRLLIDLDAADLGGTGRIRFSIPSRAEWKPNG